jgi:hypothetical protein
MFFVDPARWHNFGLRSMWASRRSPGTRQKACFRESLSSRPEGVFFSSCRRGLRIRAKALFTQAPLPKICPKICSILCRITFRIALFEPLFKGRSAQPHWRNAPFSPSLKERAGVSLGWFRAGRRTECRAPPACGHLPLQGRKNGRGPFMKKSPLPKARGTRIRRRGGRGSRPS